MNQTKVLQTTNQNLITLKDIKTRKRFWEYPWIYEDRIDERGGKLNKGKKREWEWGGRWKWVIKIII